MEGFPWPLTRFYNGYICRYMDNFYNQIAKEISDREISGFVLDVGTGPGRLPVKIAKLVPTVNIVGIDVSGDMIKIAQKNARQAEVDTRVKFIRGSTYRTGFKDSSFDFIVSTGLINHLKDPAQALNELYRILKPQKEAWVYDGRRDASKEEIRATVGNLEGSLTLPLWLIERIWPYYVYLGYKTEVYTHGKIAEALRRSLFRDYELFIKHAIVKIVLKKG